MLGMYSKGVSKENVGEQQKIRVVIGAHTTYRVTSQEQKDV